MTAARAAICRGADAPLTIEAVTLDALRADEILVRIAAAGVCHTDLATRIGQLPVPQPVVLGHEGAGVVEAVGADVTHVAPGDAVILSFNSCGACPTCRIGAPTYCHDFGVHNFAGTRPDGSFTIRAASSPIHGAFFGQSSFATHAIAYARNTVRVPDAARHLPLERLAPLGCGLMTGAGAVLRSMRVRHGAPIAVFGVGAVGLAAVMAARIADAGPIIAIDRNPVRLALARELGADATVAARADAFEKVRAAAGGPLAYAFDTTGVAAVIEGAFDLLAPMGILGLVGASDPADMLSFNEAALMGGGRRVIGILGGDSDLVGSLPNSSPTISPPAFPMSG